MRFQSGRNAIEVISKSPRTSPQVSHVIDSSLFWSVPALDELIPGGLLLKWINFNPGMDE